jgi:uncharacterized protein (TIGR01777 family)
VVHLAGESVASGRWTATRKRAIRESRVTGTRTLVDWLITREPRPEVLVSASAIGFYGDRGDEPLDESSPVGGGFLAEVCRDWEAEAERAEAAGIRVVRLRIGLVLTREGGALSRMLPLFRLGLGGPVGSGRQWFPWIHLEDVLNVVEWALETPSARAAYNLVAPGIVRQADFATALGRVLRRPALLPTPAFALRLALGELADEALLASAQVTSRRLQSEGYAFRWPDLRPALLEITGGS